MSSTKIGTCFGMSTVGPFAVMSAYFAVWSIARFPRWPLKEPSWFSVDFLALILSVTIGAVSIMSLQISRTARALLVAGYIPLMFWLLVAYSLYLVGLCFGEWL